MVRGPGYRVSIAILTIKKAVVHGPEYRVSIAMLTIRDKAVVHGP